jgi:hypothetical protein
MVDLVELDQIADRVTVPGGMDNIFGRRKAR